MAKRVYYEIFFVNERGFRKKIAESKQLKAIPDMLLRSRLLCQSEEAWLGLEVTRTSVDAGSTGPLAWEVRDREKKIFWFNTGGAGTLSTGSVGWLVYE